MSTCGVAGLSPISLCLAATASRFALEIEVGLCGRLDDSTPAAAAAGLDGRGPTRDIAELGRGEAASGRGVTGPGFALPGLGDAGRAGNGEAALDSAGDPGLDIQILNIFKSLCPVFKSLFIQSSKQ